jgi:hypothetical protein
MSDIFLTGKPSALSSLTALTALVCDSYTPTIDFIMHDLFVVIKLNIKDVEIHDLFHENVPFISSSGR